MKTVTALLVAVILVAGVYAAVAQEPTGTATIIKADPMAEVVTVTKGMLVDLTCLAAGEFDVARGGFTFTYDAEKNAVVATRGEPARLPE